MSQTIGTEVTGYLWDGDQIVRELDSAAQTVATLIHGLGLGADIGSIVKAERSGQNQFFHYDWRGSVTNLTDSGNAVIKSYTYDAFGSVTASSGSAVNPYQFSSKMFDANSGLSYFGRRHYSSSLGRFSTQDPKEYIDGLNTYAYVKNNPVNLVDRNGLCGCANPQTPGCDLIPDFTETKCKLACCKTHDDCYSDNCCSMESWYDLDIDTCDGCNADAVSCFACCEGCYVICPVVCALTPWRFTECMEECHDECTSVCN